MHDVARRHGATLAVVGLDDQRTSGIDIDCGAYQRLAAGSGLQLDPDPAPDRDRARPVGVDEALDVRVGAAQQPEPTAVERHEKVRGDDVGGDVTLEDDVERCRRLGQFGRHLTPVEVEADAHDHARPELAQVVVQLSEDAADLEVGPVGSRTRCDEVVRPLQPEVGGGVDRGETHRGVDQGPTLRVDVTDRDADRHQERRPGWSVPRPVPPTPSGGLVSRHEDGRTSVLRRVLRLQDLHHVGVGRRCLLHPPEVGEAGSVESCFGAFELHR